MKKKRKQTFWIAVYLILLVIVGAVIYLFPSVTGLLERTYIAESGSVEVVDETEGWIIRNETVYTAPQAGEVTRNVVEGSLIKGGVSVVSISGQGNEEKNEQGASLLKKLGDRAVTAEGGVSQRSGYITYEVDGLEYLNGESVLELTEKEYDQLKTDRFELPTKVVAGDPVFKWVENSQFWYSFTVDAAVADRYPEGREITLIIGEKELRATVVKQKTGKKICRVIARSEMHYDNYLKDREIKASVRTARATGVILQKDSIITKDDRQGVLVKDKVGRLEFKPINILADNGEEVAVSEDYYLDASYNFVETVNPYDEILKNPSDKDIKEAD